MRIIADLHIHSRFSMATSRKLDFMALHRSALEKGITLVGTGDFTHGGWIEEIKTQLMPAEEGLFKLRPEFQKAAEKGLPPACKGIVRFVLQVEISNIYKKDARTRKNHNLVYVPTIDTAIGIARQLEKIGNINADGRPILGLDARDLLEITLESHPLSFLIPAHIWTPWFSVMGSKSGFDSVAACFGDLTEHIFAVETGLSSDPAMNWRLSALDTLTLVSNSDAHSPANLGREANLLDIPLGFAPLREALKTRQGFLGTLEFYPDEGKYHLDGHRKCRQRMTPDETRCLDGQCPVCGTPITVGVLNRIDQLADRPEGTILEGAPGYQSIVSLREIVSQTLNAGKSTQKVKALLDRLLRRMGPELVILKDTPLEEIETTGGSLLKEAVRRVRTGNLIINGGYDGEFGEIQIFSPRERHDMCGQTLFFSPGPSLPQTERPIADKRPPRDASFAPVANPLDLLHPLDAARQHHTKQPVLGDFVDDPLCGLNADQRAAACCEGGPLLVAAGPGTGKTRTLVARIIHLVQRRKVDAQRVLAITFTRQAARELDERLARYQWKTTPIVRTFHSLGQELVNQFDSTPLPSLVDDDTRQAFAAQILGPYCTPHAQKQLLGAISLAKQHCRPESVFDDHPPDYLVRYNQLLAQTNQWDLDDMVFQAWRLLNDNPDIAAFVSDRYRVVCVDEYQDVNDVQAAFLDALCPQGKNLMVIGDPNQAIYGFRGAVPGHFDRFEKRYPGTTRIVLKTTYRLTDPVLNAARSLIKTKDPLLSGRPGTKVEIMNTPTPASEAEQVVIRIEELMGGTSLFALDSGRATGHSIDDTAFSDICVLVRTKTQRKDMIDAFCRSGLPCQAIGEDDPHDPRSQKIAVMTMHAAKGREFPIVFVAGVERGLLPLTIDGCTSDTDEERRLLYVAMTRAINQCVISYSANRFLFGKSLPGGPSIFLNDIPDTCVRRITPKRPNKKPPLPQLRLF